MTMKSFHTSNSNNNSNNNNNKKPKNNRMRRSLLACSGDLKGIDPASSLEQPTNNTKKNNNNNKKSVATGTKANNDNNDKPVIQLNKKNKNKKTRPPKAFLSVLSQPFAPWNELEMVIGEQQQQQQQQQQQDDDDNNTMSYISPTARSFLVQHLVRFLELKILTEEFATSKLLAPSPIIAQAWRAVILSANSNNSNKNSNNNSNSNSNNNNSKDQNQHSDLYRRVLYDIQDFHERPHRMLTFGLSKEELSTKATTAMQQQQQRTQHLFQYYYGEPMLTSIDDLDTDLSLLTDTSTITDMMGLYLPRCGGGGQPTNKKQSSSCHHINKKMILSDDDGWSPHPWIWSLKWLEAVSDVLFCAPHGEDSSVARTVSLDDDDDDDDDDDEQQQQKGELLKDPQQQQQQQQDETEYDSLFTFDFLNTRHFLCRGGAAATAAATATETTAHASSCHHHSPYSAFAW